MRVDPSPAAAVVALALLAGGISLPACIDFDRELAACEDAGLCVNAGPGADAGGGDGGCVPLGDTCGAGSWCAVRSVPGNALHAVSGTSSDDVWVSGSGGLVLHWDGCRWRQEVVAGSPVLRGLYVVDAGAGVGDDVWVVGYTGDGGAVDQPIARRWHAQAWENHDPPLGPDTQLFAIAGAGGSALWFGGAYNLPSADSPRIEFWNGSAASSQSSPLLAGVSGMWAFAPGDAWAVTDAYEAAHFDGSQWTKATLPANTNSSLYAIWGNSPSDVYAAGDPTPSGIMLWDGGSWGNLNVTATGYVPPTEFFAIHGSGPQDVYFVGTQGTVLHKGAAGFTQTQVGSADLRGVWESGPTDVWLVGADGTVYHNGR